MLLTDQEKRFWVKRLLVKCPFGYELSNCPIKGLRKLPLSNRMSLVNNMADEEINTIIQYHINCQNARKAEDKERALEKKQ